MSDENSANLTAIAEWLKNWMPAYSAEKLSDHGLDMLVRYLTGDFQESQVSEYADRTTDLIGKISGSQNATDTNLGYE